MNIHRWINLGLLLGVAALVYDAVRKGHCTESLLLSLAIFLAVINK